MSNINIEQLRIDVEALIRNYPELAEDETLRADMLDAETDLYSALTLLVNSAANDRCLADAIASRIGELTERRNRVTQRVEALRALMLKLLQSADLKKIELPDATLSQRAARQEVAGEVDVDQLPDDLVRVTRAPDRTAIREALLAGRALPGLHLSNAAPTLTIKVK